MSEIDIGKELVQSLVNRISWLESVVRSKNHEVAEAKKSETFWKSQYEEASKERAGCRDNTEAAIDKFFEFIGADRLEW